MTGDGLPPKTSKNMRSYYNRPSAAIERGGGFFVPGLQGFRYPLVSRRSPPPLPPPLDNPIRAILSGCCCAAPRALVFYGLLGFRVRLLHEVASNGILGTATEVLVDSDCH